jgi:hypothetical protein
VSETGRLLKSLADHRRRLTLVLFVRSASAIAPVALLTTAAAVAIAGATPMRRWQAIAMSLLASCAAASVLAWIRRPSLAATARRVDSALSLQDRVSAALQHADTAGPIVTLIVADAAKRLQRSVPAQVFPLDIWRRAAISASALVLATLSVTMTLDRAGQSPAHRGALDGSAASSAGASSTADPTEMSTPSDTPSAAVAPTSEPAVPESPSRPSQPATASPVSAQEPGRLSDERSTTASSALERPDSAPAPRASAGEIPTLERPERPRVASPSASGSGTGRQGAGDMAQGASNSAATSGRAAGDASADRGQAGGVGSGSLQGTTTSAVVSARPLLTGAQRRHLQAQAAGAMARDDIPPDLRKYVRDYFLSLQATARP